MSDFSLFVIMPSAIIFGVLYVCKMYGFSIIPKSLKRKKRKGFSPRMPAYEDVPNPAQRAGFRFPDITRTQINKNTGHAGMYRWNVAHKENVDDDQ